MHLESTVKQTVRIEAVGREFSFEQGETIHTENSYKNDVASLDALYDGTGLRRVGRWFDPQKWFVMDLLAGAGG